MFKRSDSERTPKELAERAVRRALARLGACGFLIYYVAQLFSKAKTEARPTEAMIAAITLLVLAAVVIGLIIVDFVRSLRSGRFKASSYEDAAADDGGAGDDALEPPEDTGEDTGKEDRN